MHRLLIFNAHVFGPVDDWERGWLLTEGKGIHLMGPGQPPEYPPGYVSQTIDAAGLSLLPGFIDLHVHGAVGHELMDASPDGLREMAQFYAQHGVTGFLPTTWTASREAIWRALELAAELTGPVPGGATILGAHVEGPYLNREKCGAQDPQFIRRAGQDEALEFLDTGAVRLLALAPEFPENLWLIDECVRRGVTVSAAHTAATYDQMLTAAAHGLRQATHSFNAMAGLGHREPGTVGAMLALPHIQCELIADNIHVHPAAMKVLVEVKGPERVILITDAIRGAGMPEGDYKIDERIVHIRDGAVRLPDGQLAGSILTMERALQNILHATQLSLRAAWPMTSRNAARAIGLSARKGSLEVGKDADLVLFDSNFEVQVTIVEGEIVFVSPRLRVMGYGTKGRNF
ncbi:MAG TPA: N-acetylglucosamine-6-phosphate deacetylase [Anaerolineales bacterium]|nr:N-acetylglucosamine-6-phosphate deacetylase [Anaerolineales bacterium]